MTDDTFLDALAADPLDDVTRAVYADWLEERGDPRAEYLRAELAADEAALRRLRVEEEWAFRAGRRWDVVLRAYPPALKIPVIKAIRESRHLGLMEAKKLSETPAAAVLPGVPVPLALAALDRLRAVIRQPLAAYARGLADHPPVAAELRPATTVPRTRGVPYSPTFEAQTFLRLTAVRPGRMMSAARAVADVSGGRLFEALDACLGPLPLTVAHAHGAGEAAELASRFAGLADVTAYHAPHGTGPAEWVDVCLGPMPPERLAAAQPWIIRVRGQALAAFDEPYLRRLPRFHAEELLARLSPLGPFYLTRSEDQP
ncbi:MAG: ribosomal protein L7/L12 [Gemmataceae bacterium]